MLEYALVINIFCKAPYAVAAHFSLAAIAVEYLHAHVAAVAFAHKNKPVSAYARAPVAKLFGKRAQIAAEIVLSIVGNDKIVAKTVGFGEDHTASS